MTVSVTATVNVTATVTVTANATLSVLLISLPMLLLVGVLRQLPESIRLFFLEAKIS